MQPFRLMDVLEELEPLSADEREQRLREMDLSDAQLRQVRASLQFSGVQSDFLDSPPTIVRNAAETLSANLDSNVPSEIGQYRIFRIIGEGGMGVVYEAEQQRPHRRVALKVIRPGYLSASMLRRFEYEADVLARLEHPGIARIYEAGIAQAESGKQPFFAMEFVDGQKLDRHISLTNPSIHERLELLIKICQAVQHAHTKGIIHRDLKPANILITSDGSPKILDFGVARMTDSDIQATTLHTQSGQLIGTLPYMAPEQAAGKARDLDTSSDVYALGVIAYELLSGRMPYSLENKALHEAVRVICEEEPSRLSSIDRNLRGDVETIVQKALEKDRTRRYATAGEFAADVKRYLDYEPIAARPPSTWYQLRKFARRNRVLVTGTAAALIGLLVLSVILTLAFFRERELRVALEDANANTQAVNEFLTDDLLMGASPERLTDKSLRDAIVKALIDPAAENAGEKFKDRPILQANLCNTLAQVYYSLGRHDLALTQVSKALEIRRRVLGNNHADTMTSISDLAGLLAAKGNLAEAEPLSREALELSRRVLGNDHQATLRCIVNLGNVLRMQGKHTEAEPLHREAVAQAGRTLGDDNPDTLVCMSNLAVLLSTEGKVGEAETVNREVLERRRRTLPPDHPALLKSLHNLGSLLHQVGKLDDAEPLLRESLERHRRVMGDDHPDTLYAINNLGMLLQAMKRQDEAEPLLREGLESRRRVLGNAHPDTLSSLNNLGIFLLMVKSQPAEAEPLFAELYQRAPAAPIAAVQIARYMGWYGPCLQRLGKYVEAEQPLLVAYERLRAANQQHMPVYTQVVHSLAKCADARGRSDEADHWRAELAALQPVTRPSSAPAAVPTTQTAYNPSQR